MKRFYLAVPVEYEEKTIRKIGELGAVQLTREIPIESGEKSETIEICRKFMRLYERMDSVLTKIEVEKQTEKHDEDPAETGLDQVKLFVDQIETKLDESTKSLEKSEEEVKTFQTVEERLKFLDAAGLKVDEIGNFRHIFVKVGFLNIALLPKLASYVGGTSVVYTSKPGRPRENLVVVTGLNEDKALIETTLKLLNFDEFSFPQTLSPDPKRAVTEMKNEAELKEKEIGKVKEDLLKIKEQFDLFEPYVADTMQIEEAKRSIARTKKKTLIHGWIPSSKVEALRNQVEETAQKENVYLKFEKPKPEDKVPVQLRNPGVFGSFGIFTYLQGVPNYLKSTLPPFTRFFT